MISRIISAIDDLESYPRLVRLVPEYQDDSIREILVGNYRVVYRHRGEVVGLIGLVYRVLEELRAVG